jgi:hypothetical protein
MYSQVYRLTSLAESNDKGKWFGWEIERVGPVENMDLYQAAKAFAAQVGSGAVRVKHESDDANANGRAPTGETFGDSEVPF